MLTPFGADTDAAHGSVQGSVRTPVRSPVRTPVRTPVRSPAALLRLIVWLVTLGAGVALLHGLGAGTLEAPPHSPGAWSSWWTGSDPVVATMALLRLVVLGLGWYLLVATLLGLIAHVCRSVTLWRLAELVTARSMREMVAGLVGVALVSATSAPASAMPTLRSNEGATPIPIQLVLQDADDQDGEVSLDPGEVGEVGGVGEVGEVSDVGASGEVSDVGDVDGDAIASEQVDPQVPAEAVSIGGDEAHPSDASDLLRFRRRGGPLRGSEVPRPDVGEGLAADPPTDLGSDGGASGSGEVLEPTDPGPLSGAPPGAAPDSAASSTIGSASDEHIVEAGESFWAIASDVLARAGEPTDDRTVERYWRDLIEANHDRLVVEGNPDLILPGQRLRVPPPASVTSSGVAP